MRLIIKISIVTALTFILAQKSYTQISPQNAQELMTYFADNIQHLDPIEGIYDVNIEGWGENSFRTFPPESDNVTMSIYKNKNGVFKVFEEKKITIQKIGSSSIYNFNILWPSNATTSKRIILLDNSIFDVSFSIPDQQLRYDMGRNYQAGFKVHYKRSYIKTFPTAEMYKKSTIKKENEENETKKMTEWSGTGFALRNGYVVTNFHVIDGAKSITIKGILGDFNNSYTASVAGIDKNNDLALLKIDDPTFTDFGNIPYSVSSTMAEVGENIFVLGYPLTSTMGDEIKLTTGIISSRTGFQGDVTLYQISAPIQPGNSGGPLFDNHGNIIGIVSAKHNEAENVGYAIKTIYLENFIESTVNKPIIPTNNTISKLPLTEKVKSEKNFIFYIECSSKSK